MTLTEREIQLIKALRTLQTNNQESIVSLRYVPVGETGHINQIYKNTPIKTHNLGFQLYKLLQELKKGYLQNTLFTIYWQPDIGVLQCFNGEPKCLLESEMQKVGD